MRAGPRSESSSRDVSLLVYITEILGSGVSLPRQLNMHPAALVSWGFCQTPAAHMLRGQAATSLPTLPAVPWPPWGIAFPRCLPVYQRKILSMNSVSCHFFSGLPLKMFTRMTWVGAEGLFMPCRCSASRAVPQPVCGQEGCGWPQCLFCLRRDHRTGWTSL